MVKPLPFEKEIYEIEKRIEELKSIGTGAQLDIEEEIRKLERKVKRKLIKLYRELSPWERVQVARHPNRPYTLDYVKYMITDFVEFRGDRRFGDDRAIVAGIGRFEGKTVAIIGHQKGRNTKENVERNFGMPHPEGYRKALRVMKLAEKFGFPILTFVDTPGAFPGIGAEERGQAEAIGENLYEMIGLKVPIVVSVIGEGGSGGALAISVGDRILMQENAIYAVISPEGCASILWRDARKAPLAAEALKLTAQNLLKLGVIDEIVREPIGGAHRNHQLAANILKRAIRRNLAELINKPVDQLLEERYEKFRRIGVFTEKA
ncbi:acetyl-CoA carboxylase carboxyl transferase subunit alpha [Thermosulfidibacter takaii ABI70S6]|uniref:Acetyl-coenzyme A carboxylase carboxyl transferase subunit alpha n=1 Tax=Thermosulfidibacter takaii (strain DSM 17441 / JCM 13301 / NBRC 103674 / ABI70S6) TaxID=1298851 RepID=A0A0S3QVZ4_THET7|nr:acetyl-CoA carboxylase carboxyltransferase subunit alpha [Thermosulfidibacter takaii]BAT72487.1 acetyl-CoA carboxylase carboxyl transferase subunit alpha [Thermosulfidibacter takaii ABI70S6]